MNLVKTHEISLNQVKNENNKKISKLKDELGTNEEKLNSLITKLREVEKQLKELEELVKKYLKNSLKAVKREKKC